MAINDLINLSLDEIIARGGPKFRMNWRNNGSRRGGGVRSSRAGGPRRIPVITDRRPQRYMRLNNLTRDNNMCIVNISNLGPMVTTADLQELFAEHPYEDVAVQYEPDGSSSGTAVVIFKRFEEGMKLKRQFTGVRLDGKVMDLFVLTKNDFIRGVSEGRVMKRGNRSGRVGNNARRRGGGTVRPRNVSRKPQVTSEELDRELDAYMRGSKHPKVSPP